MSDDDKAPMTAEAAYQTFIDAGVKIALKPEWYEECLRKGQPREIGELFSPEAKDRAEQFNRFLASLDDSQRLYIVNLLEKTRTEVMHSWYSHMDWLFTVKELGLCIRQERIDTNMYWDMTHDFIGRLEGNRWPNEEGDGGQLVRWGPIENASNKKEE